MIGRVLSVLGLIGFAAPASAHPHVFIDAGLEVIFDDQGNATALRISWTYDEYYSLVIAEEHAIDPDYDGAATAEEAAKLAGFDMGWDASFPGDTYALMNNAELALSRPADWTASYAGGKITSSHVRTFETPVKMTDVPLIVQVYDPSFYTAYAIVGTPVLTGANGCSVEVFEPDAAAADAQLQAAIEEMAGSTDVEGEFPAIGKAYSEEARVTCAAPS
jgi:ABC-type uncharacterized transport system substrate-binding protein